MTVRRTLRSSLLIVAMLPVMALADREMIEGVTVNTPKAGAYALSDLNSRNDSFSTKLLRNGGAGKITACSLLIDVPVGTAHGNHSFGGLCTLSVGTLKSSVMICDDDMVGHFHFIEVRNKIKVQELVDFVVSNC